jgi:hypothetical protein
MKKLLLSILVGCSLIGSAQTKLPYVIDPVTKKQVTFTVATDGTFKYTFSNGKIGYPEIGDVPAKNVYARAKAPIITITPPVVIPAPAPGPAATPPASPAFEIVGNGLGSLNLGVIANKKIKIKPGNYGSIGFEKATNVVIDATDVVIKSNYSSFDITNADNVELYGLTITDQSYRAINIRGFCTDLNLHHLTFKNINSQVITYEYTGSWDGTNKTNSKNWTIANCTFNKTGLAVSLGGGCDLDKGVVNYMSGFKFLNNTIEDCPSLGSVVYASALDNYEIAGNVINKINSVYDAKAVNGIHNGIFMISGNGTFHDNKVTNHQGNAIRAWGVSFGTEKKQVRIYNNVVWNSWKYGAFEVQFIPDLVRFKEKFPAKINYTDYYVYNNTAGRLNLSKDWDGVMLDTYFIGGDVYYYNNLGFDMYRPGNPIGNMINSNGGAVVRDDNNKYQSTATQAIQDVTNFKSLLTGVGAQ